MDGNPGHLAPRDGLSVKVAIPRLPRPESSPTERQRVKQACQRCRRHKIRCSGQKPRCEHYSQTSQACMYTPARRDRLKIAEYHCDQMSALLRDMRGNSSAEHGARIDELLQDLPDDYVPSTPRSLASDASKDHRPVQDMSAFDADRMMLCDPDAFDSSPAVTQPHTTYTPRVLVPAVEVRLDAPQSPHERIHDSGGHHGPPVLPWQAHTGDFAAAYEFPDNFTSNQLSPWQHTSHIFPRGYPTFD